MEKITLYDVIDIRTGVFHSVVHTREKYRKWFVPADDYQQNYTYRKFVGDVSAYELLVNGIGGIKYG